MIYVNDYKYLQKHKYEKMSNKLEINIKYKN